MFVAAQKKGQPSTNTGTKDKDSERLLLSQHHHRSAASVTKPLFKDDHQASALQTC